MMQPSRHTCSHVAMHGVMQLCCHACCYAAMLPCLLSCSYVAMHVVLQQCCHATVLHRIHVAMETEAMKLWRYTRLSSHAYMQLCSRADAYMTSRHAAKPFSHSDMQKYSQAGALTIEQLQKVQTHVMSCKMLAFTQNLSFLVTHTKRQENQHGYCPACWR
jgi:hypothetical protein